MYIISYDCNKPLVTITELVIIKNATTNNRYPVVIGRNIFHPMFISWSYLYLGKAARTKINKKQKKLILILKIIAEGKK